MHCTVFLIRSIGSSQKQEPQAICMGFLLLCWHLLIVPGRFQPSIVSTSELNCRVRDGNGCTLTVIDTNVVTRSGFEPLLPA